MKISEVDIYDETEFESWLKKINGTLAQKNYCNLIEEHSREMDKRNNMSKDMYLENLPLNIRWDLKGEIFPYSNGRKQVVLDINTSEKIRNKAYKFMNIFISCISKMGGGVYVCNTENNDNTMFTLLQSRYKCVLYEKQVKLRDKMKIENRKMSPLYESKYNGELYFEVFFEKKDNWELLDNIEIGNSYILENKLVNLLYKLRDDAVSKKIIIDQEMAYQAEERKKEIIKWEEEKIRKEQDRIEKEKLIYKQKVQEKIKVHIDKWEYINKVSMYINNLRSSLDVSNNERKLILNYCDYVEKIYSKSEFYKEIIEFSHELEI